MELIVDIEKNLPGFRLRTAFSAGRETLGLLGASGSGKSMTLRCIAGLETPDRGRIVLNGRTLFDSDRGVNLPSRERRIGFLFQNYALFPHLTVAQNIAFGLHDRPREEQASMIRKQLAMIQLTGLEERYPAQLSGGQQQRVALARALAVEPEALLLDEPFSALDNHLRSQMEKQLTEVLAAYPGVTLFVTHNLEEAYRVCRNLLVMADGRIVAAGPKEAIFSRPPTATAARLTGCKNLSPIGFRSPGKIEARDWGLCLEISAPIPTDADHVGIRAHHLFVSPAPIGESNTFPCWLAQASETPFKATLYLKLHEPAAGAADFHLQAEVSREKWENLRSAPQPWYVHLDASRLFITEMEKTAP